MTDELRDRLQAMNPEPDRDPDPDDLATVFAVIEARRSTVTVHKAHDTAPPVPPSGRWRRPVAVFAGMAIVILLAIGAPVLLVGGGDAPTADTAATTTPPTTVEAAPPTTIAEIAAPPPPPDSAAGGLVTVERVAAEYLDTMVDGGRIWDAALGGPGLVAVGEIETPDDEDSVLGGSSSDALVLVSTDGRSWDRVDDPEIFGGDDWDQLHAIWSSPSGLIAEGRDAEAPYVDVVWYASVDGIDWTLITDEDLYNAWEREWRAGMQPGEDDAEIEFSRGGPGWVAVIHHDEYSDPREVFLSSDGLEWEATTEPLESLVEPRDEVPPHPGLTVGTQVTATTRGAWRGTTSESSPCGITLTQWLAFLPMGARRGSASIQTTSQTRDSSHTSHSLENRGSGRSTLFSSASPSSSWATHTTLRECGSSNGPKTTEPEGTVRIGRKHGPSRDDRPGPHADGGDPPISAPMGGTTGLNRTD